METTNPCGFDLEPISEETKQIALEELRETPEIVAAGLKELRELLAESKTMHYETDDEFLMIFLRPCKYYANSAYKLMKNIAKYRAKYNKMYDNLLPETIKDIFYTTNTITNCLIDRDQKGRRILAIWGKNWEPKETPANQLIQLLYLIHMAGVLEPTTQVRGIIVIVDLEGIEMKHIVNVTPSFIMKIVTFIQSAMPLRLKEFHIINNPPIFEMVWKIIKPVLWSKSKERVIIHGSDKESLYKYVDRNYLPEDFGGTLPKITYGGPEWYTIFQEQVDFFKKWNSCGLNKRKID